MWKRFISGKSASSKEKSLNILRDGTNKTDIEIAVELWIYGSLEEEKTLYRTKKIF